MVAGATGALYGTTAWGGSTGAGIVFELAPPSVPGGPWVKTTLHNFDSAIDGFLPQAPIITGNQVLIGATDGGGPNGAGGVAWALQPPSLAGGTWTEKILYAFNAQPTTAYSPSAALLLSGSGMLYGPGGGGPSNLGTIFALTLK